MRDGQSATYIIGIDLEANSTITVPKGANVTITSVSSIEADRRRIYRKVTNLPHAEIDTRATITDATGASIANPGLNKPYVYPAERQTTYNVIAASGDIPAVTRTVTVKTETGHTPGEELLGAIDLNTAGATFRDEMFIVNGGSTLALQHITLDGMGQNFVAGIPVTATYHDYERIIDDYHDQVAQTHTYATVNQGVYVCKSLVKIAERPNDQGKGGLLYLEDGAYLTNNKIADPFVDYSTTTFNAKTRFTWEVDAHNYAAGSGVFISAGASFVMDGGGIVNMRGNDSDFINHGSDPAACQDGAVFIGRENFVLYANATSVADIRAAGLRPEIPGVGRGTFYLNGGEIGNVSSRINGPAAGVAGDLYFNGGRVHHNKTSNDIFYVAGSTKNIDHMDGITNSSNYNTVGAIKVNGGEFDNNLSPSVMFAAIYGDVIINDCDMHDNRGSQGLFYVSSTGIRGSTVTINGGKFHDQKAVAYPVIYCLGGGSQAIVNGGEFYNNFGGNAAISLTVAGCEAHISGGKFYNNTSRGSGGVVQVNNGTAFISGGEFYDNVSYASGGAVYMSNGNYNMTGGEFRNNTARAGNGGAVYLGNGNFNMSGGSFDGNRAIASATANTGIGGAVYVASGNFIMTGGEFTGNTANQYPGFYCGKSVYLGGHIIVQNNKLADGTEQNIYLATEAAVVTVIKPLDDAYISISKTLPEANETIVAKGVTSTDNLIAINQFGRKKYTINNSLKKVVTTNGTNWFYDDKPDYVIYENVAKSEELYKKPDGTWWKFSDDTQYTLQTTTGTGGAVTYEVPTAKVFTVASTAGDTYVTPIYITYTVQTFDALCCYNLNSNIIFEADKANNLIKMRLPVGHTHTFERYEVEPSCDTQGYTTWVCPGDHYLQKWTREQLQTAGYSEMEINLMAGKWDRVEYVAPTGHEYVWNSAEQCFVCNHTRKKPTGETVTCGDRIYLEIDKLAAGYNYRNGQPVSPTITGRLYRLGDNGAKQIYRELNSETDTDFFTVTYQNNHSVGTATVNISFDAVKSVVNRTLQSTVPTGDGQGQDGPTTYSFSDSLEGKYLVTFKIVEAFVDVKVNAPTIPIGQTQWFTDDGNVYFGKLQVVASINSGTQTVPGKMLWLGEDGQYSENYPKFLSGTNTYHWKFVPTNAELAEVEGTHTVENVQTLLPTKLEAVRISTDDILSTQTWDDIKGYFRVTVSYNKGSNATGNTLILQKANYTVRLKDASGNYFDSPKRGTYTLEFSYTFNDQTVTTEVSGVTIVSASVTDVKVEMDADAKVYETIGELDNLRDYLVVTAEINEGGQPDQTISRDDYDLKCTEGWLSHGAGDYVVTVTYTYVNASGREFSFDCDYTVTVLPNSIESITASWRQTEEIFTTTDLKRINNFGTLVVTAHYLDGTAKTVPIQSGAISGYTVSGDISTTGNKRLTITYRELNSAGIGTTCTAEIEVTVVGVTLTGISYELKEGQKFFNTDTVDDVSKKIMVYMRYSDGSKVRVYWYDTEEKRDEEYQIGDPYFYVESFNARRGSKNFTLSYTVYNFDNTVLDSEVDPNVEVSTPTVSSIKATVPTVTSGGVVIYNTSALDDLKKYMYVYTVMDNGVETAVFTPGSTSTSVALSLPAAQNGAFVLGNNTVTVLYTDDGGNAFSTTVTVRVAGVSLQRIHVAVADEKYGSGSTETSNFSLNDNVVFTSSTIDDIKGLLKVTGYYANGDKFEFDITQYELSGTIASGTQSFTVKVVDEKNNAFTRIININVAAVEIVSIEATMTQGTKVIYANTPVSEILPLISVEATYNDGSTKTFASGFTASVNGGAGFTADGDNTVTVTYEGKTDDITEGITVTGKAVKELNYNSKQGTAIIYSSADAARIAGYITVFAIYNDGTQKTVTYDANGGADKYTMTLKLDEGKVTVNYTEDSATLTMDVVLNITQLSVTSIKSVTNKAGGSTVNVYAGSTLDAVKNYITVMAEYNDGVERELAADDYTLSGTLTSGQSCELTLTCGSRTATFNVNVAANGIDTVTGVTSKQGSAVIYESAPLDNLKQYLTVTARFGDGTSKALDASDYTITGDLYEEDIKVVYQSASGEKTFTVPTGTLNITKIQPKQLHLTLDQDALNKLTLGAGAPDIVKNITVKVEYNDHNESYNAGKEYDTLTFGETASDTVYTLSTVPQTAGTHTITVSYTRNGKTVTDTFSITIGTIVVDGAKVTVDTDNLPDIYVSNFVVGGSFDGSALKSKIAEFLTFELTRSANGSSIPVSESDSQQVHYVLSYDGSQDDLDAVVKDGGTLTVTISSVGYTENGTANDQSTTFTIDAIAVESDGIIVKVKENSKIYSSGEMKDVAAALDVKATFNDGTEQALTYATGDNSSNKFLFSLTRISGSFSLGGDVTYRVSYTERDDEGSAVGYQTAEVTVNVIRVVPKDLSVEVDETAVIFVSSSEATIRAALTVKVAYNNDETKYVDITNYVIDPYTLAVGSVTLDLSYTYNDTTVTNQATITVSEATIASLSVDVSQLASQTFYTSTNINTLKDYITVKGVGADGSDKGAITAYTLTVADGAWKAGLVVVTVTYDNDGTDITATFQVLLQAYSLTKTEVVFDTDGLELYGDYKFDDVKADLLGRVSVVGTWSDGNDHSAEHTFGEITVTGTDGGSDFTVKYSVDGTEKTETINLTVTPLTVSGIEIKANDTYTLYTSDSVNKVTDVTELYLTYNSGNKTELAWENCEHSVNATGWSAGGNVNVSVNVTVDGVTYNSTIELNVTKVEITSLEVTYTPKASTETQDNTIYTSDTLADVLAKGTLVVKGVNNDGTKNEITSITAANLTGTLNAGTATITVTYNNGTTDVTATFTVTVVAVTASLQVEYDFDNETFYETTDLSTIAALLTVKLVYNDGTEVPLSYGGTGYSIDGSLSGQAGQTVTLTVKYTLGTEEFSEDVNVEVSEDTLEHIKATFVQGTNKFYKNGGLDDIKDSGRLTVIGHYTVAGDTALTKGYTIEFNDPSMTELPDGGAVTLKVTYGGKTDTFVVNITAKAATGIEAEYTLGDGKAFYTTSEVADIEKNGTLTVKMKYNDGSEETVVNTESETKYTLSASFSAVGDAIVTVTCGLFTDDFTIDVKKVEVEKIVAEWQQVEGGLTITDGKAEVYQSTDDEALKKSIKVTAYNNDGSKYEMTVGEGEGAVTYDYLLDTQYQLSYSFTGEGDTDVTVTGLYDFAGLTCKLTATIKANLIVSMKITYSETVYTSTTVEDIYADNEHLTVTLVYGDGSERKADSSVFEASGDFTTAGDQTLTITYIGSSWDPEVADQTATLTINVVQVAVDADSVEFEYTGEVLIYEDTVSDGGVADSDAEAAIIDEISEVTTITFNDGIAHAYTSEVVGLDWVKNSANSQIWDVTAHITVKSDALIADYTDYTLTFSIEISYKITYGNIGSAEDGYGNTNPATYMESDGDITLVDPTRSGFVFGGWFSDAAMTAGNEVTAITANDKTDVTVYAKWEITTPVIKFADTTVDYTGEDIEFTINVTNKNNGLNYTYEWTDGEGNTITAVTDKPDTIAYKSVGEYNITVKVTAVDPDNSSNTADATISVTLKIEQATNEITVSIDGWTYGDEPNKPTATATFGLETEDDMEKVTYKYFTDFTCLNEIALEDLTDAGTYYIKAYMDAATEYLAAESYAISFEIAKKGITVPTLTSKEYTGETLTADIESGELYTVEQNDGGVAVGTYDVVLKLVDSANYKWADDAITGDECTTEFEITQTSNEITVEMYGWTYGEDAVTPVATVKFGDSADVTYKYSTEEEGTYIDGLPTDAGTYYIKGYLAGTDDWADGESDAVEFVIAKAASVVTIKGESWTYGETSKLPTVTKNVSGGAVTFTYSNKANGTYTAAVPSDAGIYYVKAASAATDNYEAAESNVATFKINKAGNAITSMTAYDWMLGGTVKTPTVEAKFGADTVVFTYSDSENGVFTEAVPETVGPHYVKATIADTNNYAGVEMVRSFTVRKANAQVVGDDGEVKVDISSADGNGLNPDAEISVTPVDEESLKNVKIKDAEVLFGYDVTLTGADELGGKYVLKVAIDEQYREEENMKVYYFDENGQAIEVESKREGNYIVFETDRVTRFIVCGEEQTSMALVACVGLGGVAALLLVIMAVVLVITRRKAE